MKKYEKQNRGWFVGAWICVVASNLCAVLLQFLKGDVLDFAVSGDAGKALKYAVLLAVFILCEVTFYFLHNLFRSEFVTGCTGGLKQDIFAAILRCKFTDFGKKQTGEYLAKYTNEADAIRYRYFSMLPLFWDIFSKILLVGSALFPN